MQRTFSAFLVAMLLSNRALAAQATLKGFVMDSVHGVPLVNAIVTIEGTPRSAVTDKDGRYRVDNVLAGSYRVVVTHPLLDTLGVSMRSLPYPFVGGESHDLDLFVPGGERLVKELCPPARIALGPGVMRGFVRDPDTNSPAVGAKVELVYQVADVIGRKSPRVRSDSTDSSGHYRICGLPADMSGKVQVFLNGVSSGEVPIAVTNLVAVRAFSVAQHQAVAEVRTDSGKVRRVATGSARVVGRVVDKRGKPLDGARVMLQGGVKMVVSNSNGEFVLDSLPSGTQALEVRKLGYAATDASVELSANTPARTTIAMSDFVPTLAAVRVTASQDKALADVGYSDRKRMGQGFFMDSTINHQAVAFSDVMRMAQGLKVVPAGDGRSYVIQDSRSSNGCVEFWVDGMRWPSMTPGDIDQILQPAELVAIEVYHGSNTPPQFTAAGQSGCATIVAWTVAKVRKKS
jgi:hypothetical protein